MTYHSNHVLRLIVLVVMLMPVAFAQPGGTATRAAQEISPQLYVVSNHGQGVDVFDTATNSLLASIPTGSTAQGIAVSPDQRYVYTADTDLDRVSVIDTVTWQIAATIPIGSGPVIPVVNPAGTYLYVTAFSSDEVSVIDLAQNTQVGSLPISTPWGVAVSPDGKTVAATSYYGGVIQTFDAETSKPLHAAPGLLEPEGLIYHPDGSRIYVASLADRQIVVYDAASLALITAVPIGGSPGNGPVQMEFNADASRLYVADDTGEAAVEIDVATDTVLRRLSAGQGPRDVALLGSTLYVSNFASNTISIIDTVSGAVRGEITNIPAPHSMVVVDQKILSKASLTEPMQLYLPLVHSRT